MALNYFSKLLNTSFSRKITCNILRDSHITSAGIIVVGDEILKGQVPDTNSTFLAQELYNLGIQLRKISVIGDYVEEVSEEVEKFSRQYNYVITSGGIGPTHDDVTYEAVAKAFHEPLVMNPELKELCKQFYSTTNDDCPGMKLALIPKSAKLNYNPNASGMKMNYPNVSVKNVYMFPGIPELLRKSFTHIGKNIFKSERKFYCTCIYFNATEDKIVKVLNELVKEFPGVQFGSYPKLFDSKYKVKITIESCDEAWTKAACSKLLLLVPKDYVVAVE